MTAIDWVVENNEWTKAANEMAGQQAGSPYDLECHAHYTLFGALDIHDESVHLFRSTVEVSLADFAYQLMIVLADLASNTFAGDKIEFLDDDRWIAIDTQDGSHLRISTNSKLSNPLVVRNEEMLAAGTLFLRSFALEVQRHMPNVLSWQSFGRLREYLV